MDLKIRLMWTKMCYLVSYLWYKFIGKPKPCSTIGCLYFSQTMMINMLRRLYATFADIITMLVINGFVLWTLSYFKKPHDENEDKNEIDKIRQCLNDIIKEQAQIKDLLQGQTAKSESQSTIEEICPKKGCPTGKLCTSQIKVANCGIKSVIKESGDSKCNILKSLSTNAQAQTLRVKPIETKGEKKHCMYNMDLIQAKKVACKRQNMT